MKALRESLGASRAFLPINFAQRRRWVSGLGMVLLMGGSTVLLGAVADYLDAADYAERQERKAAYLERQINKLSRSSLASEVKMDPAEWRSLQQLRNELTYPWNLQLTAVERSLADDVAILSMQPDPKTGRLRILGEAKTLDDAIGFAERLKGAAGFQSVSVTHHEYRMVGAVRILGFSVLAQ